MDRNRDNRKSTVVSANGLSRRRHRTSSLRDSPEDDAPRELQETGRLRDRGGGRKDRERDREREDRDRERSSRSKKRRVDRLMHGISRQDCADESTEESINVEDEEEDGGEPVRAIPATPATATSLPSTSNHHLPRKSFPPAKFFRMAPMWKVPDEMIGVSVPRKARSVSTKRPHDSWAISAGASVSGGRCTVEPVQHRQASASPARQTLNPESSSCPISPSSNASARKKMSNGFKQRPSKTASMSFSSNQEEIEFEIAEVLYGLRQNEETNNGTSIQGLTPNEGKKRDAPDALQRSCTDTKSGASSPISHSSSVRRQPSIMISQNSISLSFPVISVAPKRKKPRPVKGEEFENHNNHSDFVNEVSVEAAKPDIDRPPKDGSPVLPPNAENSGSDSRTPETLPELVKADAGERKQVDEDSESLNNNALLSGDETSQKKIESPRNDGDNNNGVSEEKTNSSGQEERFQIDLMAPPPGSRSPSHPVDSDVLSDFPATTNKHEMAKSLPSEEGDEKAKHETAEVEESQVHKDALSTGVIVDLEKGGADSGGGGGSAATCPIMIKHSKPGPKPHKKIPRHDLNLEKHVPPGSSLPFPSPLSGWPGGISQMGYVGPLQGLVSLDGGGAVPPVPIAAAAPHQFFNQPRPKRCATHCYIARNICYHQQLTKMNSLWPPALPGTVSLFTGKPAGMDAIPAASEGNSSMSVNRNGRGVPDKDGLAMFPGAKDGDPDNGPPKKHPQILIQPAMPPGAPSSNLLHAPAFLFPLNQQQPAPPPPPPPPSVSFRSGSLKSGGGGAAAVGGGSNTVPPVPATSFGYPTVPGSETQYLAILQNNAYPFPIPAHMSGAPTSYRASAHGQALPFFNGSFYSSHHVLHPSQFQQQQASPSPQLHHQPIPSSSPALQKQQMKTTTVGHLQQPFQHQHFPSKTRSSSSSKLQNNSSSRHHEDGGEFPGGSAACNYALPFNSPNFAILPEKMQPPLPMSGVDGVAPGPGFAMSFASMEPNHGRHYHIMPGSKSGENAEEERKIAASAGGVGGKPTHSIAFSRPDLVVDGSSSSGDGSARATINLTGSATSRLGATGFNGKRHHHHHQHHLNQLQQQLGMGMNVQLEKQRYGGGSKNKTQSVAGTEAVAYSADHLPSMTAKFSSFPQSHAQWKNALSPAAAGVASLKAAALPPPQQQTGRGGPAQHISFGGNLKSCVSTNSRAQSPPMMSGSPSTSSVSKGCGGGGSPNRGAANKSGAQLSALSALQQAKVVGSPPTGASTSVSSSSVAGQQSNNPKTMQQQGQLFFSNPYLHSGGGGGAYYVQQRRRSEQQQPCSSGMLSLCPPSAVENGKGVAQTTVVGSSSQPGFPYLLPVHLKSSSDQKHPTGE